MGSSRGGSSAVLDALEAASSGAIRAIVGLPGLGGQVGEAASGPTSVASQPSLRLHGQGVLGRQAARLVEPPRLLRRLAHVHQHGAETVAEVQQQDAHRGRLLLVVGRLQRHDHLGGGPHESEGASPLRRKQPRRRVDPRRRSHHEATRPAAHAYGLEAAPPDLEGEEVRLPNLPRIVREDGRVEVHRGRRRRLPA